MSIGSILSSILPASAGQASSSPGLGTLAVQRQTIVQNLAIKQQAQAEQAVADLITQAVRQGQQAAQSGGPAPVRGSHINILV